MHSGRFLRPAPSHQMDLPLGLLLLHPVEEGEEEVGVGRRDRPLRSTVVQGRLCVLSCHLVGDEFYGRQKEGSRDYFIV